MLLKVKADLVKEIRKYYSLPLEPIYINYVPNKLKVGNKLIILGREEFASTGEPAGYAEGTTGCVSATAVFGHYVKIWYLLAQ